MVRILILIVPTLTKRLLHAGKEAQVTTKPQKGGLYLWIGCNKHTNFLD
jgi:hypothetical protein